MAIPPYSQDESQKTKSHHLPSGKLAGIVIGSSMALVFLLLAGFLLTKKASATPAIKNGQEIAALGMNAIRRIEIDGTQLKPELDYTQHYGAELDGSVHVGYEVEGSTHWIPELSAQENIASEMESQ